MDERSNILALDPATICGWAHSSGEHGVWDLTSRDLGGVLRKMESALFSIHDRLGVRHIAYEDSFYGAINANTKLFHGATRGVIRMVAFDINASHRGYSPSTIKKQATGRGRDVSKDDMVEACRTQFGIEPSDHNAADAIWILYMARQGFYTANKNVKTKKVRRGKNARKK